MSTVQFVFRDEAGDIKRTVHATENDPLLPVISELERQITRLQEHLHANKPFGETIVDLERQNTGLRESIRQHEQQRIQRERQWQQWCANLGPEVSKKVQPEIERIVAPYNARIARLESEIATREAKLAVAERAITGYKRISERDVRAQLCQASSNRNTLDLLDSRRSVESAFPSLICRRRPAARHTYS